MVLRVPPKKNSLGTFVCFTNPANPGQPIPASGNFSFLSKADNPKRRALTCDNDRVLFSARNHGKNVWDKADRKLEKYFVFAYKDGEAILLNKADAESAFTLSSTITESAAAQGAASYTAPRLNEASTARERNQMLDENFGSRRRKTNQQKMKMAAVNSEKVMGSSRLESALETLLTKDELQEDDSGGSRVSGNLRKLLPPFDDKAETFEDAYPSAGYFPPEEREAVEVTIAPENFIFDSSFAKSRFTHSRSSETKRLAGYAECLMRFHGRVKSFVSNAKDACRQMSFGDDALAESLLNRFMEAQPENLGGGFGKSRLLKDKLLIHLLVVILALEGFRLRLDVLSSVAADLRTETSTLTPLLAKIGCKLSNTEEGKAYILPLPLSFPEERRRPGAKRRKT
jgi:hypothetical protein